MNKSLLAASVSLAFSASLVGNAHADAMAQSVMEITNFQILEAQNSSTGNPLPVANLLNVSAFVPGSLNIVDQWNLSPSLNGASSPNQGFTVGGAPIPLQTACVGGPCPVGTPFAAIPVVPPLADRAFGAAQLDGAPISGLPTLPNPFGANASTAALAQVSAAGVANTTSQLTLNAGFTFALNESQAVSFGFDANSFLTAYLSGLVSATAQEAWTVSITNLGTGATVFSWSPDGVIGEGITGGTEYADACTLNNNRNVFSPGGTAQYSCDGYFLATTGILTAGTQYSLALTQFSAANVLVAQAVPEPSSVLLAGLALIGLGFAEAQRRKAQ